MRIKTTAGSLIICENLRNLWQKSVDIQKTKISNIGVSSEFDISQSYCLINGWPTNMVVDKNGIVRQILTGGRTGEEAKTEAYNRIKPIIKNYQKK